MNLTINGTESNKVYVYPNATNATGWRSESVFGGQDINFTLYLNDSTIGTSSPISDIGSYGVGLYVYTYNTSGNVNYSATSKQFNLSITPTSPETFMHIAVNGSESDLQTTYPNGTNTSGWNTLSDDSDCTYNLYRNDQLIDSGTDVLVDAILLGVDNYTYVYNTSGCTNYSAGSVIRVINVTEGSFNILLENNLSWGGTYPESSNTTG
jgi:hypothetical protein